MSFLVAASPTLPRVLCKIYRVCGAITREKSRVRDKLLEKKWPPYSAALDGLPTGRCDFLNRSISSTGMNQSRPSFLAAIFGGLMLQYLRTLATASCNFAAASSTVRFFPLSANAIPPIIAPHAGCVKPDKNSRGGTRTPNLQGQNLALHQLSYAAKIVLSLESSTHQKPGGFTPIQIASFPLALAAQPRSN